MGEGVYIAALSPISDASLATGAGHERNDTHERRPRRPPPADPVSGLAPRHARDGPHHGTLRRCGDRRPVRRGARGFRAAHRGDRPRSPGLDHRRDRRRRPTTTPPCSAGSRTSTRTRRRSTADRRASRPRGPPFFPKCPDHRHDIRPDPRHRRPEEGPEPHAVERAGGVRRPRGRRSRARICPAEPRVPRSSSTSPGTASGSRRSISGLAFVAPEIEVLRLPGLGLPALRPGLARMPAVTAQRMTTLARLARSKTSEDKPRILSTTVNALVQRVPPADPDRGRDLLGRARQRGRHRPRSSPGSRSTASCAPARCATPANTRCAAASSTCFRPGCRNPVRLDFFGDTLESIRSFDPETQRTVGHAARRSTSCPMSEVQLTTESIRRFRQAYVAASSARRPGTTGSTRRSARGGAIPGMEHWLPLFHDQPRHPARLRAGRPGGLRRAGRRCGRRAAVADPGLLRRPPLDGGRRRSPASRPTGRCRRTRSTSARRNGRGASRRCPSRGSRPSRCPSPGRAHRDRSAGPGRAATSSPSAPTRARNVFEAVIGHIRDLQGRPSAGSSWRLVGGLPRAALPRAQRPRSPADQAGVADRPTPWRFRPSTSPVAVWGLESGFEAGDLAVISEQDILGRPAGAPEARSRSARRTVLTEVAALTPGDLVVHVDHGIGRFEGLKTIEAAGAPHDCLELHYAGGDRLFLPVENIELLTRYGSEETEVQLDRLGGGAWQARKARMKQRIREMAGELMKIAAARVLKEAPRLDPAGRALRRVRGPLPLRRDRGPAERHRGGARRSRRRAPDGPARLRRRRLRQDGGGPARRLRDGDERQAGGGGGADHAPGAPAFPHLLRSASGACRSRSPRPRASCRRPR